MTVGSNLCVALYSLSMEGLLLIFLRQAKKAAFGLIGVGNVRVAGHWENRTEKAASVEWGRWWIDRTEKTASVKWGRWWIDRAEKPAFVAREDHTQKAVEAAA